MSGNAPITITEGNLHFGANPVEITFTSTGGLNAVASLNLTRIPPFAIVCNPRRTSDGEYVEIVCELTNTDSQTVVEARYTISGVDRGELEGTSSLSYIWCFICSILPTSE